MPVIKSKSKEAFKENVRNLMHEVGKSPHVQSRAQALAIAYETKRRARAEGGEVVDGPIISAVPGRTDRHEIDVGSSSYVLPSETVSHLGENNTLAGLAKIRQLGPHGLKKLIHAAPGAAAIKTKHRAKGGAVHQAIGRPVPVVVAGGEHILSPENMKFIGDGDATLGHRLTDNWVMHNRKDHIATLRKLSPPAKD